MPPAPSNILVKWTEIIVMMLILLALSATCASAQPRTPMPYDSIPPEIASAIHDAAQAYSIPDSIAFALVSVESGFASRAVSHAGARGLTQVMPQTGRLVCGLAPASLFTPRVNAHCGLSFLSWLYERYGDWRHALIAYHRGPARVDREHARGALHGASSAYAAEVLKRTRAYSTTRYASTQ